MLVCFVFFPAPSSCPIFVAVNSMEIDDQQSTGLIKGINIGLLGPGVTACKTVYLRSSGTTGERLIDFSIQSLLPSKEGEDTSRGASHLSERCELLQTLAIPTVAPFKVKHETIYSRRDGKAPGPAHLSLFDPDFWDDADGGKALITSTFECVDCDGAGDILVDRMQLVQKV